MFPILHLNYPDFLGRDTKLPWTVSLKVSWKTSKYITSLAQKSSTDFYQGWDVRTVVGEGKEREGGKQKEKKEKEGGGKRKERERKEKKGK